MQLKLTLGCVVDAEVSGSVNDDTLHGHIEALVQTFDAIRLGDLYQAVSQAGELSFCSSLADISSQTGSCEVKGVDKAEGRGTSSTT